MHPFRPQALLVTALLAFSASAASTAHHAPTSSPSNNDPASSALPAGWRAGGDHPEEYRMSRAASAHHDGRYGAAIAHVSGDGNGFGTLAQAVRAEPYRGKRVILKGWLKTEDAGSGQMWLRIDATDRTMSMDNMDDRPVTGTTGWKQYEIVMDVPEAADKLAFGVFLAGKGSIAFDDLSLDIAPDQAQPTRFYDFADKPAEAPFRQARFVMEAPTNMGFEQ